MEVRRFPILLVKPNYNGIRVLVFDFPRLISMNNFPIVERKIDSTGRRSALRRPKLPNSHVESIIKLDDPDKVPIPRRGENKLGVTLAISR